MGWLIGLMVLSAIPWLLRGTGHAEPGAADPPSNVVPFPTARVHDHQASSPVR